MPDRCHVLLRFPDGLHNAWMEVEFMDNKTFLVMEHYPTPDDPQLRVEIALADLVEVNWPTMRWSYAKTIEPPNPWGN